MFTNEEKKEFKECTPKEQQEIFGAFLLGNLEYFDRTRRDWIKETSLVSIYTIYRVAQPKEDTERITPIKGIPWEVIDSRWNWAAMDKDGCICLYDNKPKRLSENWAYAGAEDDYFYVQGYFKLDITGVEWSTSLTKRPDHC